MIAYIKLFEGATPAFPGSRPASGARTGNKMSARVPLFIHVLKE